MPLNLFLYRLKFCILVLTEKHTQQFALYYLFCFLINYVWNYFAGLTFTTLQPVFFLNRLDFTLNLLLLTNLHHFIIESSILQICFDLLNLLLPCVLVYSFIKKGRFTGLLALTTSFFALIYYLLFSAMSFYSAEVFIAWIFIPLILHARFTGGFYYMLHIVRIIFIIVFFSSALWKIRTGAMFNTEQMSATLLKQHGSLLANNSSSSYAAVITYLINTKAISFSLYWLGFLTELIFVTGLFTKRFDKLLIIFLFLFLMFDYALMGINYCPWIVFGGCFYFSNYNLNKENIRV